MKIAITISINRKIILAGNQMLHFRSECKTIMINEQC